MINENRADEVKATNGQEWKVEPMVAGAVDILRKALETEYARLKEQFDAVPEENEDFDPFNRIYFWIADLKDLVDALDEFSAEPSDVV